MENFTATFRVWGPLKESMALHIVYPKEQLFSLIKDDEGYWNLTLEDIHPATRYFYQPDNGRDYPDPASPFQPEGVHGPSQIVDHKNFKWSDQHFRPPALDELIFYELHVGTFTPEGTFSAIIPRLNELAELGINAIELMPVNQFPGERNWGYDGVFPYAVQHSYGGPEGLKSLVNACHKKGIAVFLDVVYNHLGPEGNYFPQFGPYFTDKYKTPWGDALNFDGEWSDGVRDFFSENALYWFNNYHIDGLRYDAIHMIYDNSAIHFLEYMHDKVKQLELKNGRSYYLVAESDLNSPKVLQRPENGGYGFNAQWLDDFHHALYTRLDEKGKERYEDYGKLEQLAKAYTDGFVLSGEWVQFRKKKYGRSSAGIAGNHFVVFNQNHDQIGNRVKGERLCMLVNFERQKIAAAAVLLSPYLPMLFMGEEYADESPFFYFVSHSDAALVEAVRKGRKEEFSGFHQAEEPPDPQNEKTFAQSILNWESRLTGKHQIMLRWHTALIQLRRELKPLRNFNKSDVRAEIIENKGLILYRTAGRETAMVVFNFSNEEFEFQFPQSIGKAELVIDSNAANWHESGQKASTPQAVVEPSGKVQMQPLSVSIYLATAG